MVVRVWAEERRESWVGVKLVEGEGLDDEGAVEVGVEVNESLIGSVEGRRGSNRTLLERGSPRRVLGRPNPRLPCFSSTTSTTWPSPTCSGLTIRSSEMKQ
jgi:hypothetical protein